ncbi:hypothetical protein SAMN05216233_11413 [Desulfoluna spongiiphila]|uniref:LPP20 lipoprotein n=1 Tax=Desulfoluna spongiiphila TaxID=419481 RepID=A0A1G5HG70_9BACT|nr:hypothetical protein SAMN05216233_11413 [Desulfoluna spongiiphila]
MRCAGWIVGVVFLLGCLGCGGPGWYVNRDLEGPGHVLVGYGQGETMAEARADAAREIAESLGVRVSSTGEMVREQGPGGSSGYARFRVSLVSRFVLDDLTPVKHGKAGGTHFVALAYDNRTFMQKLGDGRMGERTPGQVHASGYKASLPFSYNLSFLGIFPDDYHLVRRHGGWAMGVAQKVYPIPPEEWFRQLFVEKPENQGLRLVVTPSGVLRSGRCYRVLVTPPQTTGYLSLYHVSESGQTLRLMANQPVTSREPVSYPDAERYKGLEAIATDGNGSRDMILATWAPEPMETPVTPPPVASTPWPGADERTFSYGDLLDSLKDALWASRFVWILGR